MAAAMIDPVNSVVHAIGLTVDVLRTVFFAAGAALAVLCTVEWAVRTHRLSAFTPMARGTHRLLAKPLKIVEHRVLGAGGNPVGAPWWLLVAFFVLGILVLSLLDFLRAQIAGLSFAFEAGPRGVLRFIVDWAFTLTYIAIFVPLVAALLQLNPFSRPVRIARAITEPMLNPIRRAIPVLGGIDLSPLILYAVLAWILKPLVMRAL